MWGQKWKDALKCFKIFVTETSQFQWKTKFSPYLYIRACSNVRWKFKERIIFNNGGARKVVFIFTGKNQISSVIKTVVSVKHKTPSYGSYNIASFVYISGIPIKWKHSDAVSFKIVSIESMLFVPP